MRDVTIKWMFILLGAIFLAGLIPQPAQAVWQVLLNEHFEEDQENQLLQWPWYTDQRQGHRKRWHWNPWPPHFRFEPTRTDYCWGLQDYIYNRFVVRDDDQSLWCAYTNQGNVNNPRWPEDDDYMHRQNAWVWWGPVDLTGAAAAVVSFWTFIDLDNYARDSLSVVLANDIALIGAGTANPANIVNCPLGKSFSRGLEDWTIFQFSLDTLLLDGDTVSYLDEEEVWLAFVWQSDRYEITGMGAFIDDVMFMWDDGLVDIRPVRPYFGHPENDDEIRWSSAHPRLGEEVYFKLNWDVIGIGETDEFTIDCYLDDELFFTENRVGIGDTDSVFSSVTDTLWVVTTGEHFLRWELDTPVDEEDENGVIGVVNETNELNNVYELDFTVIWNPPPMFELIGPAEDVEIEADEVATISWTVNDSNDFDNSFTIYIYATTDTSGLAEDPDMIFNYMMLTGLNNVARGGGSYSWDLMESVRMNQIAIDSTYYIVAFAMDSDPQNYVNAMAPGRVTILPPESVGEENLLPADYDLADPFPNPFNRSVTIGYNLPSADYVMLTVYDLTGRQVATLVDGTVAPGHHTISWNPDGLSAGVYIVRLHAGERVFHRKAVYMP